MKLWFFDRVEKWFVWLKSYLKFFDIMSMKGVIVNINGWVVNEGVIRESIVFFVLSNFYIKSRIVFLLLS